MAKVKPVWIRHPSWWIVVVSGMLVVVFSVAIVRELINSHTVRQQVRRLEGQVAVQQQRQHQLQDLIDYLGSPTFQEQEARLKLGLKKSDEQVIVVPASNASTTATVNSANATDSTRSDAPTTNQQKWWQYFFGKPHSSNPTNA